VVREIAYDEVFDAQRHFRSILDSMARPGKINPLDPVQLDPPPGLNTASVLVAFALMDASTTFEVVNMHSGEGAYLAANTNAVRSQMSDASFIFAAASEPAEMLDDADCGTLLYPDTSATLVLGIEEASDAPLAGGLRLTVEGPGVDGTAVLFVRGVNPDLLLALQARNAEFPMGLDAILTFAPANAAPCVVCLPRTAKVSWEVCP
jgi:alpha-D-ribose 1-methylphosphonate 5-triphosphate synthase subunit PhnH